MAVTMVPLLYPDGATLKVLYGPYCRFTEA